MLYKVANIYCQTFDKELFSLLLTANYICCNYRIPDSIILREEHMKHRTFNAVTPNITPKQVRLM